MKARSSCSPAGLAQPLGAGKADVQFNLGTTQSYVSSGFATEEHFLINAPSGDALSSAGTITNDATFAVTGPPAAGTNATITNAHAIYIPSATMTTAITNSYGLTVNATTGATNNYAAQFMGGNVGIGSSSPLAALDVNGAIDIKGANGISYPSADSTTNGSITIGAGAQSTGATSAAYENTVIGYNAINGATIGTQSVNNVVIGARAGATATWTTAHDNVIIGHGAANSNTSSANGNVIIGSNGYADLSSGVDNVMIGYATSSSSSGRNYMVGIGANILGGTDSVVIGQAAAHTTFGTDNVIIGFQAGYYINSGSDNIAIGTNTMAGVTGNRITGSFNTAVGSNAGLVLQGASANNTFLGYGVASTTLTTGNGNILIGNSSAVDTPTATTSNFLDIGNAIFATGMTGSSVTSPAGLVGIGTATMASTFEVNGNVSIGYPDTAATSNGLIVIGNVGIGTNNPAYLLQVGSASASGIVFEIQDSGGTCTFQPTSSSLITICSSDARLKDDINDAHEALPQLADMRVRDYTIKASGVRTSGVIAQEMLRTHPDMVHMGPDGFYGVEAPNVWLLVKAIQELKAANDDLVERVSADDDAVKEAKDAAKEAKDALKAANDNIAELRGRLDALEAR